MKKDKTLLQEGTIRRFMKLAGTQPLASDFVNEMGIPSYKEDEVVAEDQLEVDDELEGGHGDELELDLDVDVEEDVPEVEDEVTFEEGELEALANLMQAAMPALEKLAAAADGAPGPEELGAPELELEPEDDMTGAPLEVGDDEEEPLEDEEELEEAVADVDVVDDEKVMQEVYKRVAKRLSKFKGK